MNILRAKHSFYIIFAVLFIILISYGQTLGMYFWKDDSALMFKLQNPEGPAGSYGAGIIGNGPYKYLITMFVPFFHIFKMNPFGYFLVGLIAYCFSTGAFYLFTSELFKNRRAAIFSTMIFAAGYIGSDTMLQLGNSWQTNLGLILALLSFWAYLKLFRDGFKYYFVALFFFLASVEFVFIRSHSLILPILAIDLVMVAASFKIAKIPMVFARQLPFWLIFYNRYLIDRSEGGLSLGVLFKNLLSGKVEILSSFFATLGNSIIPVVLQVKFITFASSRTQLVLLLLVVLFNFISHSIIGSGRKLKIISTILLLATFLLNRFFIFKDLFWYRSQLDFVAGGMGMYTVVIAFGLSITLWNKKRSLAMALILGLVVLMSQVFGYFIKYPEAILTTTHRYLSYAFVGYSIIIGTLCFLFFERIAPKRYLWAFFPLGLVLAGTLYLGVTYQKTFIKNISDPTRYFYSTLKQLVPQTAKGDVFYFDVEDNSFYKSRFGNFFSVGSMPDSTALAIYYGVDRYDISLITDFNELLYKLSKGEISIDKIHSFYFGSSGLIDTSTSLKILLKSGSSPKRLDLSASLVDLAVPSLSPLLLTIEAKVVPDLDNIPPSSKRVEKKMKMVSYLLSRQGYYQNVKPSSSSQWKFQEVTYVTDNNLGTSWRAHRIHWHEGRHEELVVDLGSPKEISNVNWTNWRNVHTPASYNIEISLDGKVWKTVKQVENGPEKKDNELVSEYFNDETARFVKMSISKTFSGEEPALTEFEVVESKYRDVDIKQAFLFIDAPAGYISTKEELEQILLQAAPLLNLKVTWETDKGKGEKELPIGVFGTVNRYEFVIDGGGTALKKIAITTPNIPAKIDVQSGSLQNLSLTGIERRKLIKNVVEN